MILSVHLIKLTLAEKELTISQYADLCGISRQNISTILTRGTCAPKTAGKLAKGLGVCVSEIVREQ